VSDPALQSEETRFFVVGTTRSGTTVLGLMLGHHPEIAFPGEFEFFVDYLSADGFHTPREQFYDRLSMDRHFRTHRLSIDRSLDYPALARSFIAQMKAGAAGASKRLVGVAVHRHFDRLLELFPRARFLHIVRDPRDVGPSWIERGWAGNLYTASRSWGEVEALWDHVSTRIAPERRHEIRFEELITRPHDVLGRACSFLGVPFADAMLEYHRDTSYEPLDPRQAGKWRERLTQAELRLAEAPIADLLERRGYPRAVDPPRTVGALRARCLELDDWWSRLRTRVRLFGLRVWIADQAAKVLRIESWRRSLELRRQERIKQLLK
jgi:hypothetical protein